MLDSHIIFLSSLKLTQTPSIMKRIAPPICAIFYWKLPSTHIIIFHSLKLTQTPSIMKRIAPLQYYAPFFTGNCRPSDHSIGRKLLSSQSSWGQRRDDIDGDGRRWRVQRRVAGTRGIILRHELCYNIIMLLFIPPPPRPQLGFLGYKHASHLSRPL